MLNEIENCVIYHYIVRVNESEILNTAQKIKKVMAN